MKKKLTSQLFILLLLFLGNSVFGQTVFKGTVQDAETQGVIPNAKIGVTQQGIGVLSASNGRFSYKKYHQVLDDGSVLMVSAPGYETISLEAKAIRSLLNIHSVFQLKKANTPAKVVGNRVKVFWDISEGLQTRDLDKELTFLANYLNGIGNAQVQIEVFNDKLAVVVPWTSWDGDISRFRESVTAQTYNGPSNYSLLTIGKADQALLFSNGDPNFGVLDVGQDISVSGITTVQSTVGISYLSNLAAYTSGTFVPLWTMNLPETTEWKTVETTQLSMATGAVAQGTVMSLGKPLQGASVIVKGTFREYSSESDGRFSIPAAEGDILQIRYLGMFPKDVLVTEGEDIDVELLPKNDVLKEVVLTSKYKKVIVGKKEMRGTTVPSAPGGVTAMGDFFVTSDDIRPNGLTLEQVLQNLFSGVNIKQSPTRGPIIVVKGVEPSAWVVDNVIVSPPGPLPFYLSDKDIESIVVKESSYWTTRYGPLLAGLAVVITTKNAPLARDKYVNSALVKGNEYTEEVAEFDENVASGIIKGIVSAPSGSIQGASISIKGTLEETFSKADGSFQLQAKEGDILQVRYLGMFGKDVRVEGNQKIEVKLLPSSDLLNEVVLEGKKKQSEIINGTGPVLESGHFLLEGRRFDVTTLTRDDYKFEHWGLGLLKGLDGKLSGLTYDGSNLRVRGSIPNYFIDGRPADVSEMAFLNTMLIETISIKKSIGGVVGPAGSPGTAVFVQTTLNRQNNTKVPSPLVTGNEYTEEVATIKNTKSLQIRGKIYSASGPIQGATISRNGSFDEYTTKADGSFELSGTPGDVFVVYYLGMYSKGFEIAENSSSYDIELIAKNDVLDEVVLTGDGQKKEMVQTAWGEENRDKLGYDAKVLTKADIPKGRPDIASILNGRFAGITASEDPRSGLVVIGRWDGSMLIVIDGNLFPQNTIRPWISPDRVASITVIKSVIGTARYGTLGKNGVVEIVTTDFSSSTAAAPKSLLVEGNEYTEELQAMDTPVAGVLQTIEGAVFGAKGPLKDVAITLKGTFNEVYTNTQGLFSITANIDDVLVINKGGYYPKEVLVESQNIPKVILTSKNQELDEIVVAGSKRVDNTVETAYGEINEDQVGTSTKTISKKSFADGATSLRQLITGKVAGVSVEGGLYSGSQVVYKIRGGTQSINTEVPPIWIVNGTPYQDPPEFLDVQQIASISVLKSVSATSRYGSLAAGGAFLIKTTDMSFKDKAKKAQRSALVSGNEYVADSKAAVDASLPAYIVRFRESGSLEKQFKLYQKLSRTQESPLEFYVDAANYFSELDAKLGDEVRADLAYISRNNTKALRTLAYVYDTRGDTKNMVLVNERIAKIAPQEAQSYRDLALAYQQDGQYNKALELYINMLGEQIKGVNFDGLEKPLRSELYHLTTLHKDKIDFERLPNEWLRVDFDIDIRMVVEWSDRSVPFEFQFVNPEKKFFKWTHTLEDNRERLQAEQRQGFQMEEFIIDDAPSGEWLINIQYLGDESDYVLPPFLKYTVFKNYGTPQETREIKVVKLFKQLDKVTLGKVNL